MELSPWHLLIVAAVVVLLFGTKKIPELMRGVGEGVRTFKEGMRGDATHPSQTTPSVTLMAAPNPAMLGQPITLTAQISPAPSGSAPGTVSFFNGATLLGSCNVNASGVAVLVASGLPSGVVSLTAAYSGNTTLAGSAAALTLNVNAPAPVTS
jgi:sec-independent protein translocase protein TatA